MDYTALQAYTQAHQSEMLAALETLVNYESPGTEKVLTDRLARHLAQRFSAAGATATLLPQPSRGDLVRVSYGESASSLPPTLILCHFDTVWPTGTLAERPFHIADGRAWGPGTFDMKAGIVIAEFALRALQAQNATLPRPVVVLFTSDEEIGSAASRPHIEALAREAAQVLVLESPLPGGALKTARKGVGGFTLEAEGRAAHAGIEPEKGINAITELAHQVLALSALNDLEQGTTVNVGVIRGGSRSNVVPALASAEVDVRVWSQAEAHRVEAAIRGLRPQTPGAKLLVQGGFERPAMERTAQTAALFARAQEVGRLLGQELLEGSTGGTSDANFTAALGVPTLDGLGAPGAGAHAENEHIEIAELPGRVALIAALLEAL